MWKRCSFATLPNLPLSGNPRPCAAREALGVADVLGPRSQSSAEVPDAVSRLALGLETLRQPFDADRVNRLILRSRQDPPEATLWIEMEALLATPLLYAET